MKHIACLSFSGQDDGSCNSVLGAVSRRSRIPVDRIHAMHFAMSPCVGCAYLCFRRPGNCPIDDDLASLISRLADSSQVILVLPTYSGNAPALFSIFAERLVGITEEDRLRLTRKIAGLIVVGDIDRGAANALNQVLRTLDVRVPAVILSGRSVGLSPVDEIITRHAFVQEQISDFVDEVIRSRTSLD